MIYFIQAGFNGPIKVGHSVDPAERIRALATASPHELHVLCVAPGGSSVEAECHRAIRMHRVKGEWFHPHADVFELIERVKAPEYRIVNDRAYAVLRRITAASASKPCPFCGVPHKHSGPDGHRVAHCVRNWVDTISVGSVTLQKADGYILETERTEGNVRTT